MCYKKIVVIKVAIFNKITLSVDCRSDEERETTYSMCKRSSGTEINSLKLFSYDIRSINNKLGLLI